MLKRIGLMVVLLTLLVTAACTPPILLDEFLPDGGPEIELPAEIDLDALQPGDVLPLAPDLRTGVLDNGLTYYIRRNTEPANRAELWLVVNAGSLQEDEDQLGLAHFVEHMLFNGTERYPEQALINFFETVGMTFGPDINAYTSFEETVYQLRFPTDDPEIVGTAFEVLEDWAGAATMDDREIDLERPVIVEEYRLRFESANGRLLEQIYPIYLGDSHYTARFPIGDMDIIRNAPYETLRRFYTEWYRPELMAVIAVGDFDVDDYEGRIIDHFSGLTNPPDARPRQAHTVPDHEDPRFGIITDPELTFTLVEVTQKRPSVELNTLSDYRSMLVKGLFESMVNFRLNEVTREANSPFLAASVQGGRLVRPVETTSVTVIMGNRDIIGGVDAVLTEIERVRRFGFVESELVRAKNDLLTFYQRIYAERNNLSSRDLADELRRHHLEGEAVPGVPIEYALALRLIPSISLAEVNRVVDTVISPENRTVLLLAPEEDAARLPSEAALAGLIDDMESKAIDPYQDMEIAGMLVTDMPDPVDVVEERYFEESDVTEVFLANGVRVLMKPTRFREEQIAVYALSPGGTSLVEDEDYVEATYISNIVSNSGIGSYEYGQIIRMLAGQSVGVGPYITEVSEGFRGAVVPRDAELILQLIWLYATQPRADQAAFSTFLDQVDAALRNRTRDPDAVRQDTFNRLIYGDTLRRGLPPLSEFESFDLERAFAIYQDRFSDFSDFTFIFVGNFQVENLLPLLQVYLGNLPAAGRVESWRDVSPPLPVGVIEEAIFVGQGDRSISQIMFTGEFDPTPENALLVDILDRMMNIRITEDLREVRSGIYAGGASGSVQERPAPRYEFSIAFGSDPERAEEMVAAVFELIEQIQTSGPSDDLLVRAKAQISRDRELAIQQNSFWVDVLEAYAWDPEAEPVEIDAFDERLSAITGEQVQQAAQALLPLDRYVRLIQYPAGYEE